MDSDHKFTDVVKEFQISSLTELFDSFGESTLLCFLGWPVVPYVRLSIRPFICSLICSDIVTTISHKRLE